MLQLYRQRQSQLNHDHIDIVHETMLWKKPKQVNPPSPDNEIFKEMQEELLPVKIDDAETFHI